MPMQKSLYVLYIMKDYFYTKFSVFIKDIFLHKFV